MGGGRRRVNEKVKCENCGLEILREEGLTRDGEILCEDCYVTLSGHVQTCDPWAVRAAKEFRKGSGLQDAEGLTEQQKAVYDFIKDKQRVTPEELYVAFQIPPQELENLIATLRHCELVKGQKEGAQVYLTLF
jgi:late competence protein required for DNA uptake (superfamily II DNA/RNA helicase)